MNTQKQPLQLSLNVNDTQKEYLTERFFQLCEQDPNLWKNFPNKQELLILFAISHAAKTIQFVRHQEEGIHDEYLFKYSQDNENFICPFGENIQVPYQEVFTKNNNEYTMVINDLIVRAKVKPGYNMSAGLNLFPFYKKEMEEVIKHAQHQMDKMLLTYCLEHDLTPKSSLHQRKI